jgi:hypothetical protein
MQFTDGVFALHYVSAPSTAEFLSHKLITAADMPICDLLNGRASTHREMLWGALSLYPIAYLSIITDPAASEKVFTSTDFDLQD